MKAKILALLRERGDYVSGQEMCDLFQVSRTAVWKAMNQLKKEGYQINAVPNRGYLLDLGEEVYGSHELESRMDTVWAGRKVLFFDTIDSTNLRAKLEAEAGAPQGTLIVADEQSAGRGRRGREWDSPAGKNIYCTLLLRPDMDPNRASMLTLVMALAVAEGIRRTCRLETQIKWPNDIVIEGRKVCGMLTEMSVERDYIHYVVVGVGINVGVQEFPEALRETAASLQQFTGAPVNRAALIAEIMKSFETIYQRFCRTCDCSEIRTDYEAVLVNYNHPVRVMDPKGEYTGIARGINDMGELLVELPDGTVQPVFAGEVSVRGVYGYT